MGKNAKIRMELIGKDGVGRAYLTTYLPTYLT